MLTTVPAYVTIIFIVTVLLTCWLFLKAVKQKRKAALIIIAWLAVTGLPAGLGYFLNTTTLPPRFLLAIVPAFISVILLIITNKGMQFTSHVNLRYITILHVVRIPVELVLYWLFLCKAVPELMTFAGRNFDILSGITAPFMVALCFKGMHITNKKLLLVWNIICLVLLLNIVFNAVLAAPFVFQQFAFDQPNIAVLYFPFVWLPACIVMLVLYSHLAAIRLLTMK